MTHELSLPWVALLALGAGHGINPAMGWLFAVAQGLQHNSHRAVWGALLPLAAGHATAIGVAVVTAGTLGLVVPPTVLRYVVAALLVGLGGWRLVRHRHVRFGGMQMRPRELAIWSFLMATVHGAGLMVLPFLLSATTTSPATHIPHASMTLAAVALDWNALGATAIHTASYIAVTGVLAVLIYERLGLRLLRTAWINLDLIWAAALVLTGIATVAH